MSNETSLSPHAHGRVPEGVRSGGSDSGGEVLPDYRTALREFRVKYWTALMEECGHSVLAVARRAKTNRTHAYRALAALGIPFEKDRRANRGNWGNLTY